eukprot:31235-Pelagococcus_subviridis.AAC.17
MSYVCAREGSVAGSNDPVARTCANDVFPAPGRPVTASSTRGLLGRTKTVLRGVQRRQLELKGVEGGD